MTGENVDLRTFTVAGAVQAEILCLVLEDGAVELTGPCGAEPWYVEVAQGADPMETAARLTRNNLGEPVVLHSTSWRQTRGGVVLTFVAVLPRHAVAELARLPVVRSELARGGTASAAPVIAGAAVIEHGLRHLAWLLKDDSVVADALGTDWRDALADYVPEPFRHL